MRRFPLLFVLGVCLLGRTALAAPNNGYIGVFGDAAGTNCCITLNSGGNGFVYVYAVTAGASAAGFTAAEFKVSVEPSLAGATFDWTPAAGATSTGTVFDNGSGGGAAVSFSSCQTQTGLAGDKILLGSVHVKQLTGQRQLVVRAHDTPANSTFQCPSVVLCDAPTYTQVCLTLQKGDSALGGEDPVAFISAVNSPSCSGASCGFVAVDAASWSAIKDLYR